MLKNQKGITLITLIVTIAVMAIITGVTVYSGTETIQETKKTAFISELEMIQAKVNTIYEKINSNDDDAEFYASAGKPIGVVDANKLNIVLNGVSQDGFKYFGPSDLSSIGLDNINQEILINFRSREVISLTGFEIDGVTYYKLKDMPNYSGYNVEYKGVKQ